MLRHKLNFKGQTLLYFKTNYGNLFSVRPLLGIIGKRYVNNRNVSRYVKPELCVMIRCGNAHGTLCTGLKGVKQLFADNPDKQLEKLLLSNGIVTGEMPCAADVRVVEEFESVTRVWTTTDFGGEIVYHVNATDVFTEDVDLYPGSLTTPYVKINGKKYYCLRDIEDTLFQQFVRDSVTPYDEFTQWPEAEDHYVMVLVHGLVDLYCNDSRRPHHPCLDAEEFVDLQGVQFFVHQAKKQRAALKQLGIPEIESQEVYNFVTQQQKQLLALQQRIAYLENKISAIKEVANFDLSVI